MSLIEPMNTDPQMAEFRSKLAELDTIAANLLEMYEDSESIQNTVDNGNNRLIDDLHDLQEGITDFQEVMGWI